MQLSMILGFFTAWPVNAWLVRVGCDQAEGSATRAVLRHLADCVHAVGLPLASAPGADGS
nr:DUF4396 domain-containing protein [Streptomyces sp. alain-838]